MKQTYRVALAFSAVAMALAAQDPLTIPGFQHFYNLEYEGAIADFQQEIADHPKDPNAYNHLAQTVLYRELYRTGALESELVTGTNPFLRRPKMNPNAADRKQFDDLLGKAMQLSQARLAQNPNDTDALYALGVAYGLRANYRFLVAKAWIDALHDASDARKYHNRVTDLDPNFTDARLVQGVYDYIVGSLPLFYRLLGFIAGFHGDRERGIRTLQIVAQKGQRNRYDAEVALAAIYRRERRAKDAIPLLNDLIQRFPRSYLLRLELAQMYGDAGDKTLALAAIGKVDDLRRAGAPGYKTLPEEKIRYARGNVLFWYNDLDRALDDMRQVTANANQLDLNTGVYAWMRLGQIYDLKGQRSAAVAAYKRAIEYAPESDAAKESRQYIARPFRRS